ncbi:MULTISPECIES: hypothetical protein [Flavobacteriaceae]|uniref:hypothetical protein n=1 Tax=Flavobacteriaceae TaxID=49546 RepID=UPI0014915316|nr:MULTISPECIES: hypothetical protein [Allomuricauda]MDC6366185.1 hypothetical protein [Muricauda sp. AC10]
MRKLLCVIVVFSALLSCKKKQEVVEDPMGDELVFNYQKIPDRIKLNAEAAEIVESWDEFKKFNESVDVLYRATNNEDLILAIDDLVEKEKDWERGVYPDAFNSLQVKSRQRVLKTYLFKVKSHLLEKQETTQSTVQMLEAYNALREQLNVMVNSQLDTKLILDEE